MAKFKFVCKVNVIDGKDEAFNHWHTSVHMPEVLAAAGFTRAQRLKLVTPDAGDTDPFQYLIIYDGECDDTSKALESLFKAAGEGRVGQSDTIRRPSWMAVFEEIPGATIVA